MESQDICMKDGWSDDSEQTVVMDAKQGVNLGLVH